ncbi:Uma2 family endonuclease [Antarcticirhabdus aurantiaca]|uniref:Uma2 family endonuclease n=1 Tax=Antarcticirhabdus aurantiaca TaxID=2606717 RepID=A0ACD4NWI1_9HYPH|nr:Uma2 family endonuclease [Antarcticirhabdus aurantiaca]WAJ31088.1 Uma2 family endonuclease [Jeongeuplla avenae]
MTVEEFLAWAEIQPGESRYELIDGIPVRLMAPEAARHVDAKARIWLLMSRAIRSAALPCRAFVDGIGVRTDKRGYRIPDVTVTCGTVDDGSAIVEDPIVLVEVVSPGSTRRDAGDKLLDYFRIGSLVHYLIVYPDAGRIVHHRREPGAETIETRILAEGNVVLDPPGFSVAVPALLGQEQIPI